MSPKSNRVDRDWFSLFDPKTGHNYPPIEGGFEADYEVDEEYTEAEDEEEDDDDDEFNDGTEEEAEELVYDDEEEDDE